VTSLRGHLLIAAPQLLDPNFRRTVVLVGEHGDEGAMGVVLNRPSGVTVGDAVPPLAEIADEDALVFVGGPVQEDAVIVLAEFAHPDRAASIVFSDVGFVPGEIDDPDDLGSLPRARVFAGYAGWGPRQLETELADDAWIVAPAEADDVFTSDPNGLWRVVLRRLGGSHAILALLPEDPRVN
jgi:putative transcriptional regulator